METLEINNSTFKISQALMDVLKERSWQDNKWGESNHHPFVWLGILSEEVGEYSECVLEGMFDAWTPEVEAHMRLEAVQAAAVALALVECIDRNKGEMRSKTISKKR